MEVFKEELRVPIDLLYFLDREKAEKEIKKIDTHHLICLFKKHPVREVCQMTIREISHRDRERSGFETLLHLYKEKDDWRIRAAVAYEIIHHPYTTISDLINLSNEEKDWRVCKAMGEEIVECNDFGTANNILFYKEQKFSIVRQAMAHALKGRLFGFELELDEK